MAWRLAHSLATLRAEVDAWAPGRSKASDGTIGDTAHGSRNSRHNPNRQQVVTALDLTHDPDSGCDIHSLARRLVQDPHPELEYVISNGEIAKRRTGFRWERYTGSNKHTLHAHFAVGSGPDSAPEPPYDSTRPWGVDALLTPQEADMTVPGWAKKAWEWATSHGYVDGDRPLDPITRAEVVTILHRIHTDEGGKIPAWAKDAYKEIKVDRPEPDAPITEARAVTLIHRALGR